MKKIGWKIYFWFLVVMEVFALLHLVLAPSPYYAFGVPFNLLPLIAIFGYSYDRQIGLVSFWKIAFWVYLLTDFVFFVLRIHERLGIVRLSTLIVVYALTFLINVFSYIGMYRYAFKKVPG